MYRFIESIRVENHVFLHLPWHQTRLNRTREHFFPGADGLFLEERLRIPPGTGTGIFKCRVVYGSDLEEVTFVPYNPRPVHTLRLVNCDEADYSWKSENREDLDRLMLQKGEADDILIVRKGCITDASYANVALSDGRTWFTPDTPLLQGTCRQRLLDEGLLKERRITPADLGDFSEICLINAMLDLNTGPRVNILP